MADMVSTTITYGKKRSLFRSIGSRRRQKYITESFPTKKVVSLSPAPKQETIRLVQPEPLKIPLFPINRSLGAAKEEGKVHHADAIDEMASLLLDETNSTLKNNDETTRPYDDEKSSANTPKPKMAQISDSSLLDELLMSPSALSPLTEKIASLPDNHSRALRIGKSSPTASGKASRRVPPTRSRSDSALKRRESGLIRPLPQSKTSALDPLKSHPTPSLQSSSSVPLRAVDGNVRQRKSDTPKLATHIEIPNADEINQKLCAMLAATNALKPAPMQTAGLPSSKFTRMVPARMFAKMSSAWERLHPKSSQAHSIDGKSSKTNIAEEQDKFMKPGTHPGSPCQDNLSPISTIEIRLNEGDNLNKKKVQKIVGGQVVRKPVADDGKSLRTGKSIDDPFGEPGCIRTPTRFESRLQSEAEVLGGAIPPVPLNPFESEKEFDNDIEDRILSSTPVGSSTPRARIERVSNSSSDRSPTKRISKYSKAQLGLMLDNVTLKLVQEELSTAKPMGLTSLRASQRKLVDPVRRVRQHSISTTHNMDAHGLKRTKKHPSPSKEALEDLEMAFRKYAHLKVSGARNDELDELACSFVSNPRSLAPRDKNRLISTRLSKNIGDVSSPGGRSGHGRPHSSPSSTRIPRPIENPIKLRPEIRLAPRFRPQNLHADDDDELQ